MGKKSTWFLPIHLMEWILKPDYTEKKLLVIMASEQLNLINQFMVIIMNSKFLDFHV